jgi:HK97 family phage major capsid protein
MSYPVTDEELLAEFQRILEDAKKSGDAQLQALRGEINQQILAIKRRLSLPPGSGGPPEPVECESLGAEFIRQESVTAYLRNPQPGGLRIELHRPVLTGRKAATPITSGNWLVPPTYRPGVVVRPRRRLVLRDVLSVFPLTSSSLTFAVENTPVPASPGAAYQILEGDAKVEISIGTTPATCTPSTIACWVTVSKQVLDDSLYLQQYLDERMTYEVSYVEEAELLNGSGAAGHIKGFLQVATAYDPARTQTGDTGLDVVSHAETQLEEIDVYPTAFVVNPADAEKLRLTKTTYGSYVWLPDVSQDETGPLWGLTPIVTNSMPKGSFLVGDFGPAAAQIIQRESAIVSIAFEHSDYFVRNLIALRCEERVGLAIYQPWAYVKGTLTMTAASGGAKK